MDNNIKDLDKLIKTVQDDVKISRLIDVFINVDIRENVPRFIGFPVHYNYSPVVSVSEYVFIGVAQESPDQEQVRCAVRKNAFELGLILSQQLEGVCGVIKLNDLPLEVALTQYKSYSAELAKIEDAHKNYQYL